MTSDKKDILYKNDNFYQLMKSAERKFAADTG